MAASTNWYQQVLADVKSASIRPEPTKAGLIDYYQQEYTGRGSAGWKQHLVKDLANVTGMKTKNLEKRFDTQRRNNPEPRNAGQYKALAAMIAPKPPAHGYHVSYDGWILFSNVCSKREFEVDITGEWARQLAADPVLIFSAMFLIYMEEDDQSRDIDEQEPSVGFCEQEDESDDGEDVENPKVDVSANAREVRSGHSGRARRFSFFS